MLNSSQRALIDSYGTLLGRILMGSLFVYAGYGKLMDPASTAEFMTMAGIPISDLLVYVVIAIELVFGAMIILGYRIGLAAGSLFIFTGLATLLFHFDLSDQMQIGMLTKNLAIMGGLLYIVAHGKGTGWSLGK